MSCLNPSVPSLPGCISRRTRRYDPAAGDPPASSPTRLLRIPEETPEPKPRFAPPAVPVCGVQMMGAEDMTASEAALSILERAKLRAAEASGRPAWDSSWRKESSASRLLEDLSGVAVCGVQPVAQARWDSDKAHAASGGRMGGCGARIRDVLESAEPMAPAGEGEHKSILRKLLELQMPAKHGGHKGLIRRFEASGGRLYVADKEHATSKVWLATQRLVGGRAVRCLGESGAEEYPAMQALFYEVEDSMEEAILGYKVGDALDAGRARARWARLGKVLAYIDAGVRAGEGVLVHCRMGTNRSVVVAAAYLMVYHAMTAQEAIEAIQARGFTRCVVRQAGFTLQLLALHHHLQAARRTAGVNSWEDLEREGPSLLSDSEAQVQASLDALVYQEEAAGVEEDGGGGGGARGGKVDDAAPARLEEEEDTGREGEGGEEEPRDPWLESELPPGPGDLAAAVAISGGGGDAWLARVSSPFGGAGSERQEEQKEGFHQEEREEGESALVEVLEGNIWQSKVLVLEASRSGAGLGGGAGGYILGVVAATSTGARDQHSLDHAPLEMSVDLDESTEAVPAGEREMEVHAAFRTMREMEVHLAFRTIRVSFLTTAERDRLVTATRRLAKKAQVNNAFRARNAREGRAGELAELDELGRKGGVAQVAQMMLGEEGEEDEVWI
ncbi:hypothetical protein T484DRAFT_1901830 [Baffinella frigidus]|nr:hypothetical protein T484DRAFT_1901830 [Cryptophyta sp. CCMP2293]